MSTDPKGEAGKLKPQLQLIPPEFNEAVAGALADGASRYGPWNWRENKIETMTYLGAMRRHIDDYMSGEEITSDTGVSHLGAIGANCAILLDAGKHGTLIDNRPGAKSDRDEFVSMESMICGQCGEIHGPLDNCVIFP